MARNTERQERQEYARLHAIYGKSPRRRAAPEPEPDDDDDDFEGGIFVLSGGHATAFMDRMFGGGGQDPDDDDPDDDDQDDDDQDDDEPEPDPEPRTGPRFFSGRRQGRG